MDQETREAVIALTWLFPEPELQPGEVLEGKMKAQFIPSHGRQTTGYLYLTNRNLIFVPGRGTPKNRATVISLARRCCASVAREQGLVSVGRGSAWWRRMRITLEDGHSVTFGVRKVDDAVAALRESLRV